MIVVGILGDSIGKRTRPGRGARPTAAPAAPERPAVVGALVPPPGSPSQSPTPQEGARSELRRRRDDLAEQVTELHWDLGGLAYEMAIRDHFRLDLLVRRAAVLQDRDAELAEVERLLCLEESASAGSCPSCAAPHSRGAAFCWRCGATLMERSPADERRVPDAVGGMGESTAVMNALLAPPTDG
jgi:hypothetical protein